MRVRPEGESGENRHVAWSRSGPVSSQVPSNGKPCRSVFGRIVFSSPVRATPAVSVAGQTRGATVHIVMDTPIPPCGWCITIENILGTDKIDI